MKRTNTCRVFGSYAIWFESFLCNFRLWVLRQLFDTHTHWWSRYQLVWHWQVAGVIRLATRQSRWCKNHQLKLKLAKPQIRRRKASRSMLFIIIFEFGYYLLLDDERSCISATLRDCHAVANPWLFSSLRCYLWFWFIQWHSLTLLQYFLKLCLQILH